MKMQSRCVKNHLALLVIASFELIRRRWALGRRWLAFSQRISLHRVSWSGWCGRWSGCREPQSCCCQTLTYTWKCSTTKDCKVTSASCQRRGNSYEKLQQQPLSQGERKPEGHSFIFGMWDRFPNLFWIFELFSGIIFENIAARRWQHFECHTAQMQHTVIPSVFLAESSCKKTNWLGTRQLCFKAWLCGMSALCVGFKRQSRTHAIA